MEGTKPIWSLHEFCNYNDKATATQKHTNFFIKQF